MKGEVIGKIGNVADAALSRYHTVPYADRINMLLDALHTISQECIEWENQRDYKEAVNG